MDYYAGLDVSLRSVAVCAIDVDGKHIFERKVECEIDDIVRSFQFQSRALVLNQER